MEAPPHAPRFGDEKNYFRGEFVEEPARLTDLLKEGRP
jgi:hypothetical protein